MLSLSIRSEKWSFDIQIHQPDRKGSWVGGYMEGCKRKKKIIEPHFPNGHHGTRDRLRNKPFWAHQFTSLADLLVPSIAIRHCFSAVISWKD